MKYPVPRERKTRRETSNEEGLLNLIARYPEDRVLPKVIEAKKLRKAMGYLYETFLGRDGRMHPQFTFLPKTGRLSSRAPNFQNIPQGKHSQVERELAEAIRRTVIPSPGCVLVELDWKAIEALLVGFFANDPDYILASKRGIHDIFGSHILHRRGIIDTPKTAHDPDLEEWIKWFKHNHGGVRALAKKRIHAGAYGQKPPNMAKDLGITIPEVLELDEILYAMAPLIPKWQKETRLRAHTDGKLINPFGYIQYFFEVFTKRKDETWGLGKEAWEALAFLPQSTGAAMLREVLLSEQVASPLLAPHESDFFWLLVPVHDSLLFECLEGRVGDCVEIIRGEMQREWPELGGLSVDVEVKVGTSWGTMDDYR